MEFSHVRQRWRVLERSFVGEARGLLVYNLLQVVSEVFSILDGCSII